LTADVVAARGQAAGAVAQGAAQAATVTVDLCIEVAALQQSSEPGQPAQWSVAAWATGGNVPNAALALQVSPAGTGTAQFSFGCGSGNGASTCNLGTVDASSAHLQLQAQLAVPLTTTVTAVSLTATGSATGLLTDPAATAPVAVLASTSPVGAANLPAGFSAPNSTPSPTLSPTGNAAGLFPTVAPSVPPTSIATGTRQVGSTSALPTGASHVGVELVGLVALATAFVLAVTRVSIRRPSGPRQGTGAGTAPLPPVPGEPPSGEAGGAERPPDV
jgi:hypothetical protein